MTNTTGEVTSTSNDQTTRGHLELDETDIEALDCDWGQREMLPTNDHFPSRSTLQTDRIEAHSFEQMAHHETTLSKSHRHSQPPPHQAVDQSEQINSRYGYNGVPSQPQNCRNGSDQFQYMSPSHSIAEPFGEHEINMYSTVSTPASGPYHRTNW